MNKALGAFRKICKNINSYEFTDEYKKNKKLIETTLKEHELMKQTKIIVNDKEVSDEDLEKLKNQRTFVSNLEECEIKPLLDKKTQKKLKALDILKDFLYIDDKNTLRLRNGAKVNLIGITFVERKVADLLKEVLK